MTKILLFLTLLSTQALAMMETFKSDFHTHLAQYQNDRFSPHEYLTRADTFYSNYRAAKQFDFDKFKKDALFDQSKTYLTNDDLVPPQYYKDYEKHYEKMTGEKLFSDELLARLKSGMLTVLETHEYHKAIDKYYLTLFIQHSEGKKYEEVQDVLSIYHITEEQYNQYHKNKEGLEKLVDEAYERTADDQAKKILQDLHNYNVQQFDSIHSTFKIKVLHLLKLDNELIGKYMKGDEKARQQVHDIIQEKIDWAVSHAKSDEVLAYYDRLKNQMKWMNVAQGVGAAILVIMLAIALSNLGQNSQVQQTTLSDSNDE